MNKNEIGNKIEQLLCALAWKRVEAELFPLSHRWSEEQDDVLEDIACEMAYHALDAAYEQLDEVIARRKCELQ